MKKQNKIILAVVAAVAVVIIGVLAYNSKQGSNLTGYIQLPAPKVFTTEPAAKSLAPDPINRAEAAKLLVTKAGFKLVKATDKNLPKFSDVDPKDWYYLYVETAAVNNIMMGYQDGSFKPANKILRAEFAKGVVTAFALSINTTNGPHFKDVPANAWFYPYVETLYHWSVVAPYPTFSPASLMGKTDADQWTTKAKNPVAQN